MLHACGPNSVEETSHLSVVRLFLRQYESPLVLILIFAAVISLSLKQWHDAVIILIIVLGSTLLGFSQEYRASAAVEQLKRRLALNCRVMRDGVEKTVPASTVVPGDLVLLSAGNLIPADGLVVAAQDFLVTEASLTGESFPVEKQPGTVKADAPLAARTNTVFLGTSVRSGTARVLVVETGRRTAFGKIGAQLRTRHPETDFERGVRNFGYLLIRVMMVIVLFVLAVNLLLHRPVIESLMFAAALAVGMSPELLPAIVSVTLSSGARAMSRRGVIVRRLAVIENLGSMDILCTDKTGTLTEGTIVLKDAVDARDRSSDEVRRLAFLNASFESGIDNPLDAAVVAAGNRAGLTTSGFAKRDEIPFDFLRRRLTIVVAEAAVPTEHLIVTKGAVDNVLEVCSSLERDGGQIPITPALRAELDHVTQARGTQGFRVLAVATRRIPPKDRYDRTDEQDMTLRGFLVFYDPPKPEVQQTIDDLARLGTRIKVISGDNRYVTAHLAQAVGLNPQSILTGDELGNMSEEALWHRAPLTDLFVEIDPQQKERIVRALQKAGHSVGYLGDGINDAPALHAADVGISVMEAVDVARESADIILLSRDLDVLRSGVEDGRRTFANTIKYISITTSANFGNMVSMALATPLLPFLPLTAKQVLLNNFLSDMPSMTISSDNVDPDTIARPPRWDINTINRFMLVFGLISSVFDFVTFAVLLRVFHTDQATFRTFWFMVSLLTELAVVLVLRTHGSAFRSSPSPLLLWSTVAASLLTLAIPFLGRASSVFEFVPLSAIEMGAVILIVLAYIAMTEGAKFWFYGGRSRKASPSSKAERPPLRGAEVMVTTVPNRTDQGLKGASTARCALTDQHLHNVDSQVKADAADRQTVGRLLARVRPAALVIGAVALIANGALPCVAQTPPGAEPRTVAPRGPLTEGERALVTLFHDAAPSVAYITTEMSVKLGPFVLGAQGAGSGFIWDAAGYVVTNNHVVAGADKVLVQLDEGEPIPATVVGRTPEYDLAVVRLSRVPPHLRPIPLGSSRDLQVGQSVYAIGNPFGLQRTLTHGIVSALDRQLPTSEYRAIAGVIQIDAAINPGNSGGPLLDSAGRLIGVNSAIRSSSESSAGVGFAIPSDLVNRVAPTLIARGRLPIAGIGVSPYSPESVARAGIRGVVIESVQPNSSAARAGLQAANTRSRNLGDLIVAVNGRKVDTPSQFTSELDRVGIGNTAELTVVRDGRERKVPVRVEDIAP
jgi:Mg2+-importing ATPase